MAPPPSGGSPTGRRRKDVVAEHQRKEPARSRHSGAFSEPLDPCCRTLTGKQVEQKHLPAILPNDIRAANLVGWVIGSFDEDVRADRFDQRQRRVFSSWPNRTMRSTRAGDKRTVALALSRCIPLGNALKASGLYVRASLLSPWPVGAKAGFEAAFAGSSLLGHSNWRISSPVRSAP